MNRDSKPIQSDSGQAVTVDLGTAGSGELFDLSPAGMILRDVPLLVPGLFVTATFELPGTGAVVAASYEVMWTKDGNASLKLFSISDQDKRHLETWLHRQATASKAEFLPSAAEIADAGQGTVQPEYPPSVRLPWFARVETPEPEPKGKGGWLLVALCLMVVGAGIWAVTSAYFSWRGPVREAVSAPQTSSSASEPVPQPAASAATPAAVEPAAAVETQPAAPRVTAAPAYDRSAAESAPKNVPTPSKASTAKVTPTKAPTANVPPPAFAPAESSQTSNPLEDARAPVSVPAASTPLAPPVTAPPAPRPAEIVVPAAAPPPVVADQPLRVSADVMQQYAIKSPQPGYPAFARRARIEGPVILGVLVGADGGVKRMRVISGPPELAAGAVDAVRQWRFRPYLQDGKPVEVQTELRFQFQAPGS